MTPSRPRCAARAIAVRLAAAAVTALSAFTAQASVTYHYANPVISYWADGGGHGGWALYAGLDGSGVTLDFTLAAPLAANLGSGPSPYAIAANDVLGWAFHGGSPFLNLGSSVAGSTFSIGVITDGGGQIVDGVFSAAGPVTIPNLPTPDAQGQTTYHSSLTQAHGARYDQMVLYSDYTRIGGLYWRDYSPIYSDLAEVIHTQQYADTWSMRVNADAVSAVPEPETDAMLLSGLGVLGFAARRRRRGVAKVAAAA